MTHHSQYKYNISDDSISDNYIVLSTCLRTGGRSLASAVSKHMPKHMSKRMSTHRLAELGKGNLIYVNGIQK